MSSRTPGARFEGTPSPKQPARRALPAGLEFFVPARQAGADEVDSLLPSPVEPWGFDVRFRTFERVRRLRSELGAFERLVGILVTVFEAREPGTFEHGTRVARIAATMGGLLGLSAAVVEQLRRGSIFHDIGALVLPDRLLFPKGPLGHDALDAVRAHPVVGYALLKGIPSLEPILPIVHRHHERLDGSGFPDGLSGSEIPLTVQIVSLADAYDVLTSPLPRRSRLSRKGALATLGEEASGGRWDPTLLGPLDLATRTSRRLLPAVRGGPSKHLHALSQAG